MKKLVPRIMECEIDDSESTEELEQRIKWYRDSARNDFQRMKDAEIDNFPYDVDDCFVYCYFGETSPHEKYGLKSCKFKEFIFCFCIFKDYVEAKEYSEVARKINIGYLDDYIIDEKEGLYTVPLAFLKFMKKTSPFI
ncbi:hypothetical protein [Lactobacillus helveticus]|uniref:hypothetical protein n=1 Tax=Lactobacillus helveticus TaxID=1587 RepID=UPI00156267DC|nr:hypothetical protein [Lactobacillus helveticus]NRO88866.1 hypothetical protein [Lactobacillus helveticus]